MNKVFISGRLTKDPEKQIGGTGAEYLRFTIATDRFTGKSKEKKTMYIECVAFTHACNFISKYCKKGSLIVISGELDSNTVERDGKKITYWSVIVNEVESASKPDTSVGINGELPFEV